MPSRASPLPQRGLARRGFWWRCITCGSWLACDPGDAVWLMHRSAAIAGKPAPTKGPGKARILLAMHHLWELACLRSRLRGVADAPQGCHRGQARSHKGACKARILLAMDHLWELACLRCKRRGLADAPQRCHRGQARSHKGAWQGADSVGDASPVGAGLLAIQATRCG